MIVESALLFGNPPGAVSMPMELGKPVASGRREIEVPILVSKTLEAAAHSLLLWASGFDR